MNNFYKAIIDGDPLVYKCGFAVEKLDKDTGIIHIEPLKNALFNIDSMIKSILKKTGSKDYMIYLTKSGDKTNFRNAIYSEYKANRKGARRPLYYNDIKKYMIHKYDALITEGQEADDSCSISHCLHSSIDGYHGFREDNLNCIVCSIDKDFNNIPGWHYNYSTDIVYFVTEIEALRNFYLQILTGDVSDNIPRIKKGWRQKEVESLLNKVDKEEQMKEIVFKEILKIKFDKTETVLTADQENEIIKEIEWRGQLVWLRRNGNELWRYKCPVLEVVIP